MGVFAMADDWSFPPPDRGSLSKTETPGYSEDGGLVLNGRFRLARRIGQGSMGQVWTAVEVANEGRGPVALKLFHPAMIQTAKAQLMKEAEAGMCLDTHPNIVRTHELVGAKNGMGLVMDYVDGQPLMAEFNERCGRTGRACLEAG